MPIKVAQGDKCIMWPKIFRKGRQEWEKACVTSNVPPRKLNIPMKQSNFIFFHNFFSILTFHSLTFFSLLFFTFIVHIITISFTFTNLLAKLSFPRSFAFQKNNYIML